MININDYINESLFDDDIQMNKLDDVAEVIKWVDLFKNPKKYPKVIKDFMSQIKKEGSERVLSHKIDRGAYYVFASCGHRFHMWGGGDGTEHYIGFLRQGSGIRDKDILRINCWRMNSKEYPSKVSFLKHSEYHCGISGNDKYIYAYKLPKKYDILVKKLIECVGQQYINESLFDVDDNENNLDKKIDLYKNAINIFKHKVFHPNTLSSFCMEMNSDSTDDDIMNYLHQMEDSEYFDFFKVLHEISFDMDWYHTFMPTFWLSDIDEDEIYSICERQKTYKKMTDQQYDLLMELGMWRIPDYKDIEEWILIEDKDFANQHWVIYIKKGMKPIHKRIMKEIIKGYEKKLKVKI